MHNGGIALNYLDLNNCRLNIHHSAILVFVAILELRQHHLGSLKLNLNYNK